MTDSNTSSTPAVESGKKETLINIRPTLFIGVGGTGMEVLMRMRRKIVNHQWGSSGQRVRIDSLADFPVAQFIQLDLDSGALIDSGRAQSEDLQFDQVKFAEDEKIIESFDMEKYSNDDDSLDKYPHIKEWLPLTPQKIANLGIDPSKGAGQIRAISRLYFHDKYTKIRDKIRVKLKTLKSGLSHEKQLDRLGLKMELQKFRIVVVGSVAGGTGSGSFLDMGWLARWIADSEVGGADVDLMLFLPTGFSGANKIRTEANGYAALMELEAAMRGNRNFVGRWDPHDRPVLSREPYKEVFLIDSGNMAQQHTKDLKDVYHLVANNLFDDFASGDFARNKRSVAVNQALHKNYPHQALVPRQRFPDMRLVYSKRYSAFGHALMDTRQEAKRETLSHRWAAAMLRSFFGVGSTDFSANRATDKQRDNFMAAHLQLKPLTFSEFPEFSDTSIALKIATGEFTDYTVNELLLSDSQDGLLSGVEQRVNDRVHDIRTSFDRKEWAGQIREAIKQLERDAVRDQNSTADTTEDRISKKRAELQAGMRTAIRTQLYSYLDNQAFGGLEYVLSLVEQVKDRLEVPGSGLLSALQLNAQRYREIKDAVRSREVERLLNNLEQTRGGFFGSGEKQANLVMDQLRTEIANSIKFHLRAKAADEAVLLMQELSEWLGKKTGVDANGQATWSGLVGEFQTGRNAVLNMLQQLQRANDILQKDLNTEHATLIQLQTADKPVPMPEASKLREWANDAFTDLGGSKTLFAMLTDAEQSTEIQRKVLRMAHQQLALQSNEAAPSSDPLIAALEQMDPMERSEKFRKLLNCAMPWVDANLAGDFSVKADQFKCFIGAPNAEEFKSKFGHELLACVPTHVGLTSSQLDIKESGTPGRVVCYCEMSGLPLTVLRGMESWRTSYRDEADKSPTHTHIDLSQFSHPIAPTPDEINNLADDFKTYLQAVMLGILERLKGNMVPPGQYRFPVAPGEFMRIGNERLIRLNGLPAAYRKEIQARVQEAVADADKRQLHALHALSRYYERNVYTPRIVQGSDYVDYTQKGFANSIASELAGDFKTRLHRVGATDAEIDKQLQRLFASVNTWGESIPYSDEDAYEWEVQAPDEENGEPARLKFRLRANALADGLLDEAPANLQAALHAGVPPAIGMPPSMGASLPPAMPAYSYHVAVNGQTYGPFETHMLRQMLAEGRINAQSMVWRDGFPAWVAMQQCQELQSLFAAPTLGSVPPLPPGMPPQL